MHPNPIWTRKRDLTSYLCSFAPHTHTQTLIVFPQVKMIRRTAHRFKKNLDPRETKSGQFEKSFEKVVDRIQQQLPRNKMHGVGGSSIHSIPTFDANYGEKSFEAHQGATQDEIWGRSRPSAEEEQRTLNMNTLRASTSVIQEKTFEIESAREKLRRLRGAGKLSAAEQKVINDRLLKTSNEATDYYYKPEPKTPYRLWTLTAGVTGVTCIGLYKWFSPRPETEHLN